jgi:predicted XRE-type DNA-binding protein
MKFSAEHKKNISLNHANVEGKNNPMFGKTHTTEAREKIRNFRLTYKVTDETKDKLKSKRKGENNNNAKLTEKQVLEIRELYKSNNYSQIELSKMFNVNPPAIGKIVRFITWKHLIKDDK